GEPKYPIGWPRCWLRFPQPQDWSQWDKLSVWIYSEFSRDTLPSPPLVLLIATQEYGTWSAELDTLAKGQWARFVFSLNDIPGRDRVTEVKFSISESAYRHGDVVKFFIDDFELIRYTAPTVASLQPLTAICFADDPAMTAVIELLGVGAGEKVGVRVRLEGQDKTVAQASCELPRGRHRVALRLPAGLKPGTYRLVAETGETAASAEVRLVDSPWAR
ncbi:MAG: hypothetical protein H5T86_16240, partial [Armatimonadetes bacterium]|nr:hypothetical protein [Armatimonadota bacterium]